MIVASLVILSACADEGGENTNEDHARVNQALTPPLTYPPQALGAQAGGKAYIKCDVTADGYPIQCAPVRNSSVDPGAPAGSTATLSRIFTDTAINYALHARYIPALHDGRPVAGHATLNITFAYPGPHVATRDTSVPAIDYATSPPMRIPQLTDKDTGPPSGWAHAQVRCTIDAAGHPHDCSATSDWPAFSASLLQFFETAHFFPALHDGVPVAAPYVHPFSANVQKEADDGFGQ